jgi:cation diffusion facilitator CzcD-associated flavoprotein CzcO
MKLKMSGYCRFGAVGPLMVPNKPKMFEGFKGKVIHTAKWDSSIDLKNKRVAVIGSGARYAIRG